MEMQPFKKVHKSQKPLVQVNLRIREDLRRRLAGEAKKSGRSFNQELVWRLENSLEAEAAQAYYHATNDLIMELKEAFSRVETAVAKGLKK